METMLSTLKNLEHEFVIVFLLQYKQISFASAKLINRIVSAAYDICRPLFVVVRYQFEINLLIFLQYLYSRVRLLSLARTTTLLSPNATH